MPNQYLPGVITIPSSLLITAITRSSPMVITTSIGNSSTEANKYIVGMSIKLFVPPSYGMQQANGLKATITAINGSDFTLNVNSSSFDDFSVPINPSAETPASISPNGSVNYQYTNGSSKAVPFQSLNNRGN